MKKLLTIIILSFVFFSCNKKNMNLSDNLIFECEQHLKSSLKDPSSYQKISIDVVDSVKMSQKLIEDYNLIYNQESVNLGLTTQKESDSLSNIIKYYRNHPEVDSTAYIVVNCQYRAKNGFGVLDIGNTVFHVLTWTPPSGNRYVIYK